MATDWQGVVFIAVICAIVAVGCRWVARSAVREMELLRRRPTDPQRGAAGTGVEARSEDPDKVAVVLPRSHQAPAVEDPRPSAVGPCFPAGVVTPPAEAPGPDALPPSAALAGFQTPAGVVNLWPTAPAGPQPPVGQTDLPPAPTGARHRVVLHGW